MSNKFKYGDHVKIKSGHYRGLIGSICGGHVEQMFLKSGVKKYLNVYRIACKNEIIVSAYETNLAFINDWGDGV